MKNKTKKVALYNPYLDTLGGGEKHILSILEVFAKEGYEISIFWDKDLSSKIKDRFSFNFAGKIKWLPNIFNHSNSLRTFKTLRAFDYFFYVTDGSYFFSGAKNNFVFCMVPDEKLYRMNLINKLKLSNYKFISISTFTSSWLKKWGIDSIKITPYVANDLADKKIYFEKKEKIILAVGRFFSHLHSKRHDLMIQAFKSLQKKSKKFSDYKLVMVGGLKKEDQEYFDSLKKLANNDASIIFKPNILLHELHKFYELSSYFWHFTGFEIDENLHPQLVEHFGISPIEAMISGCLTFCYAAGGPKEIIVDGENGFLFSSVGELIQKMILVESNQGLKDKIHFKAPILTKRRFSYRAFEEKVMSLTKVRPSSKD